MVGALIVVAALTGLRLALPSIVLHYANAKLSRLEGYRGQVDEVDIHLWRGAYAIRGLKLEKRHGGAPIPFFTAESVDFSVEWGALVKGALVGEIALTRPIFNLEPGAADVGEVRKADQSGGAAIGALMPLKINRLSVVDGEVHYRDRRSKPELDLRLSRIAGRAENLSNVLQKDKLLPASVGARATVFETGALTLAMDVDPLAASPTFMLKSTLQGVKLPALNDLLDAYAKFRVKSGDFGLYTEIAAKDGGFTGYVKPIIRNLEIEKKEARGFLRKLWAHVASAAAAVLSNPSHDQVAAKVPLAGRFGAADADLWSTVGSLLKNAFIKALTPSLEHTVRIGDVRK